MSEKVVKLQTKSPAFPHIKNHQNGRQSPLSTRENLEALMAFYQVTVAYDVIKLRANITGISSLSGEEENSTIAFLKSKCALHDLSQTVVDQQLNAIMNDNASNPVIEWLQNIERTKVHNPIDELVSQLSVANQEWAKVAFYRWFIQCVAAADQAVQTPNKDALPKFESVLTFYGGQGLQKTAFIRSLLPKEIKSYLKDGVQLDLTNKDCKIEVLGGWLVELGELDSTFKQSDISALKAFLSKQEDEIRKHYARASSIIPRQTSFFASVNEEKFLRDKTGNRRYLPITITGELDTPDGFDCTDFWAFIWQEYKSGVQWWLTKEEEVLQKTALTSHEDNSMEEMIRDVFDFDLPKTKRMTTVEIMEDLKLPRSRSNSIKIGNTLKAMGIKKQRRDFVMPPIISRY